MQGILFRSEHNYLMNGVMGIVYNNGIITNNTPTIRMLDTPTMLTPTNLTKESRSFTLILL